MKRPILFTMACMAAVAAFSQSADTTLHIPAADTLSEVVVEAFHGRVKWKTVPAAVAVVGQKEIGRYAPGSLVPVLNTVPGVRMEERSPASYRLSFRGSLLRSPFGVRNVKVYWNGIALSDGGGNTYLNLVDLGQLTGAETIKGPVASMYGAGTGGALLLRSGLPFTAIAEHHFTAGITGGSYGSFLEQAGWTYTGKQFSSQLQQTHQQADGYRDQSASRKDVVKWQGAWKTASQSLRWLLFYTDLYYQTPGGITLAQLQTDPKLSRQPAGTFPGAIQQQAAIYNKTFFAGLQHEAALSNTFSLRSFVMGNRTDFTNPFITNYEERKESNFGAGTNLVFHTKNFQWMNGAEWLYNHSLIDDYDNNGGTRGNVQFKDDVYANQWFLFSQAQYIPAERWLLTAGISLNNQLYHYRRTTDPASVFTSKNIKAVLTPRLAVSYRIGPDITLYALAAKGFSPPALAELRPSDGNFYGDLNAEHGWNYEAGIKGELIGRKLQFDLAFYSFRLQNAIVRRNNAAGAEYFVNAGSTKQSGIEALLKYQLIREAKTFISSLHVWSSYSYQPYRFEDYQQGAISYSGNALTGVPRNNWVSGVDMEMIGRFYFDLSYNHTSALPLTDANDVYARAYHLLQTKFGYRYKGPVREWHVFAGIDNLLNEVYSLGNDINAAGKRYYNAAAGRNFFVGLQLGL